MYKRQKLALTVAPLDQGLLLTDPPLAIIAEPQLYGDRARQTRRRVASRDPETIIRNLTDLSLGAPIVHEPDSYPHLDVYKRQI